MLPKWRASASAVTKPTCGIPSPNSTRENGRRRDASIERDRVLGRTLCWNPSSGSRSSTVSR